MKYSMITILGPTASGKTSLAAALCSQDKKLGCSLVGGIPAKGAEIISADSRQVYRGMDIGTVIRLTIPFMASRYLITSLTVSCMNIISLNISRIFDDAYQDIQKRGGFSELPC